MMLNRDQIVERGLIASEYDPRSLRDAGYDLRVAVLFGKAADGNTARHEDDFDLEPQGITAVVSKEIVKLPPDICAHASVKTSLCREGVLAINIGIIDPGWEGPISSVVLNFGKDSYRLKNGEPFLRLTFHALAAPIGFVASPPSDRATYEREIRQKFEKRLAASFMDLVKAAEKGSKKFADDFRNTLLRWLPVSALLLAALTFFLNFGVLSIANRAMPFDVVQLRAQVLTDAIRKEVAEIRAENQALKKQLDQTKLQLENLSKKKK